MKRLVLSIQKSCLILITLIIAVAPVYAQNCVQSGPDLIGWWPGNGSAEDIVGGNNGILLNGAKYVDGKIGEAFYFDGIDDFVGMPANTNLALTGEVTIEAWVLPRSIPDIHGDGVFSKGSGSNDGVYEMLLTSSGDESFVNLYFRAFGTTITSTTGVTIYANGIAGGVVYLNQWSHIATTYNGHTATLYVNGAYAGSAEMSGSIQQSEFPVLMGVREFAGGSFNGWFEGLIDEISLYNRALSESEIQNIFAADIAGKCTNLPPDAIAGTSLNEKGELQLDGTLSDDPDGDPLSYEWRILGEETPRTGQTVSVSDLAIGNYTVVLTVSDGLLTSTDTLLFGVYGRSDSNGITPDLLQRAIIKLKDMILILPNTSINGRIIKSKDERRKGILRKLDEIDSLISNGAYRIAAKQLKQLLRNVDNLKHHIRTMDWVLGPDSEIITQEIEDLIRNLDTVSNTRTHVKSKENNHHFNGNL